MLYDLLSKLNAIEVETQCCWKPNSMLLGAKLNAIENRTLRGLSEDGKAYRLAHWIEFVQ